MALNQIPYTNVHELNLDWVLAEIKKFDEYITSIKAIIDNLASYYETVDNLQDEVEALHNEVNSYSDRIAYLESEVVRITREISRVESDLMQLINDEANTRKAVDDDLQNQIDQIKYAISDINSLRAYIDSVYKSLRQYTDSAVSLSEHKLYFYINEKVLFLQSEIDEIHEMLLHVAINVYNWNAYAYAPDGKISFDLNNKLLYQHLGNNLTAEQYCKLGLTADEYAAYHLTADEYLVFGRDRLHYDYVFMPIAGVKQDHSVALSECINYALGTMSASEYATLDLDADAYAALDLTAYDYLRLNTDLTIGNRVVYRPDGAGITADQYAHLTLE